MKKFSTYSRLGILDPNSRSKSLLRQVHMALSNSQKRIAKAARTIKPTGGANWRNH